MYETRKSFKTVKWLLFWIVVTQNVAYLAVDAIASFMAFPPHQYVKIAIIEILTFCIPLYLYTRSSGINTEKDKPVKYMFRLNKFTVSQGICIVLLAVSGQFIMIMLNIPAIRLYQIFFSEGIGSTIANAQNIGQLGLGVVCVALIPAVLEELLMRGVVFNTLAKQDTTVAILFSTVMFAILHANFIEIFGILFLGAALASVMNRTDSLYASMLYHFVNNVVALLLGYMMSWFSNPYLLVTVFAFSIVVFVITKVLFKVATPNASRNKNAHPLKVLRMSMLNLPVILCIAIAIVVQYISIVQSIL